MLHRTLLALVATFSFTLFACGDGGNGGDSPETDCAVEDCLCVSPDDCPDGWGCENFLCVPPADDAGIDVGADAAEETGSDASGDVADDAGDTGVIVPGACTGDADFAVLQEGPSPVERCGPMCVESLETLEDLEACVSGCLQETGLTADCVACHLSNTFCITETCPMCLEAPSSLECQECATGATHCADELAECSGIRVIPEPPVEPGCETADRSTLEDVDWYAEGLACEEDCEGSEDNLCLRDCLGESLGVSAGCAMCFDDQFGCSAVLCEETCADPDSEECVACRTFECTDDLEECAQMELGGDPPVDPEQPTSYMRLVHLSPGLVALNGYMRESETRFAPSVGFGSSSDASEPMAIFGSDFDVRRASDGLEGDVLFTASTDAEFTEDDIWTMVVYGRPEDGASWLFSRSRIASSSDVTWQVFNAAVNVGEVDVFSTRGGVREELVMDLGFGTSSEAATVDPSPYFLLFDADNDGEVDYEFSVGSLEAGTDVALFFYDDDGSGVFLMAVFADGQTIRFNPRT